MVSLGSDCCAILSTVSHILEAEVVENVRLAGHNFLLAVRAPEIAANVKPGQFVMASVADGLTLPHPLLKRALAVFSVEPEKGLPSIITLLVKVVGDGTHRLASLLPDERLNLIGPLGNGFSSTGAPDRVHLLAAGGVGIASFYLLAEELRRSGQDVHLLYGARTAGDLVGLEYFERLRIPLLLTTEDGSAGVKGLITEGLEQYLKQFVDRTATLYVCGPDRMMQAVSALASLHQIPCQISVESKMACGFGVCLGCTVETVDSFRLACSDGPVFDAEEFIWQEG